MHKILYLNKRLAIENWAKCAVDGLKELEFNFTNDTIFTTDKKGEVKTFNISVILASLKFVFEQQENIVVRFTLEETL